MEISNMEPEGSSDSEGRNTNNHVNRSSVSSSTVLLKMPPLPLSEISEVDDSLVKNTHSKLKDTILATFKAIETLKLDIEKREACKHKKEKIFKAIKIDWDQLNEDLLLLAKIIPIFPKEFETPQKLVNVDLKNMGTLASKEIEMNFRQRLDASFKAIYDCERHYNRYLQQQLDRFMKDSMAEETRVLEQDWSNNIEDLTWKNDKVQILSASLGKDTDAMSDAYAKQEQILNILCNSNEQKKVRLEYLVDDISILQEINLMLKECEVAWERQFFDNPFKELLKPEISRSPEVLAVQNSNTELKKISQELLKELPAVYHQLASSNVMLEITKVKKKSSIESSAAVSEWFKSLESKYYYLFNERCIALTELEKITNAEKDAHKRRWENLLLQTTEQISAITKIKVQIESKHEEINVEKNQIRTELTCLDEMTLGDEGIKIKSDVFSFDIFLLQQVSLKLSSELNHWRRYSEYLSEEKNALQKRTIELKKVDKAENCGVDVNLENNFAVDQINIENSNTSTEGAVNKPPVLDTDCEEIRQLKLQLQQGKEISADLSLQLLVCRTASAEGRKNEEILTSIEAINEEKCQIQRNLKQIRQEQINDRNKRYSSNSKKKHRDLCNTLKQLTSERIEKDERNTRLTEDFNNVSYALDELRSQNPLLVEKLHEIENNNLACLNKLSRSAARVWQLKQEAEQLKNKFAEEIEKTFETLTKRVDVEEIQTRQVLERFLVAWDKKVEVTVALNEGKGETRKNILLLDETELKGKHICIATCSMQNLSLEPDSLLMEEKSKHDQLITDMNKIKKEIHHIEDIHRSGEHGEVAKQLQELKDVLKCQSCKVRKKDTLLQLCFHTFCSECIKKRYDSRQRKCPQCYTLFSFTDIKQVEL